MSNVPSTYHDEIDLLSLIQIVWDGKWKIASIVAVSLLSVFGFSTLISNTNFTASTKIKPITSFEFDRYRLFNASLKVIAKNNNDKEEKKVKVSNIFEITRKSLLDLYIEQIEEGSLLEAATDKFNLFNKDDFDSEIEYKNAIEKFVSDIEVLKPIKEKNERRFDKNGIRLHHTIRAEYDDRDKWKDLLTFINEKANRKVKASIINRFATIVAVQNQIKAFDIKDIDIKIGNAKSDYDRNTKDRLAFLAEQAAIARKLDIKKNTIASQRFNAQNTFVTNVETDAPFYLRGYAAIEEEIRQITSRNDKNAFTTDLYELEQQKRALEQDKTIQRAIDLFNKTPLNQSDFQATIVKVHTTDFKEYSNMLYYALAIIIGGIIGVVYVVIDNAFRNKKYYN